MEIFQASLRADVLSKCLLQAHAHRNSGAHAAWERHELALAVEAFDRLAVLIPNVRARLATLESPAEEAA